MMQSQRKPASKNRRFLFRGSEVALAKRQRKMMMKTVKRRLLPPSMYESLSYMVLGLDLLMVMR